MKRYAIVWIAFFAISLASAGFADDLRKTEQFGGTNLAFEFAAPYSNVTLTVTGPNDFQARAFSKIGAPSIDLQKFGAVADGSYTYQLTASGDQASAASAVLDNGRDGKAGAALKSVSTSGNFFVKDGAIVPRASIQKATKRDRQ